MRKILLKFKELIKPVWVFILRYFRRYYWKNKQNVENIDKYANYQESIFWPCVEKTLPATPFLFV